MEVSVARVYLKRGLRLERVPALIQKGFDSTELIDKRIRGNDLYKRESGSDNVQYVRWQSWPLLAEAYAKLKQPDQARETLAQMADALEKRSLATKPVKDRGSATSTIRSLTGKPSARLLRPRSASSMP